MNETALSRRLSLLLISALLIAGIEACSVEQEGTAAQAPTTSSSTAVEHDTTADQIEDEWVQRLVSLSDDMTPPTPPAGSYGMDPESGRFTHPSMTRDSHEPHPFDGTLDYWDPNEYAMNMKVEAYFPITVEPFHTWQNIVDFDGRRYLYQYVRRDLKIMDITDPTDIEVLLTRVPYLGSGRRGFGSQSVS